MNTLSKLKTLVIHAVSDIHRDMRKEEEMKEIAKLLLDDSRGKPDLIILAGDTHSALNAPAWINTHLHPARTGTGLVFVSGNHEYYGKKLDTLDQKLLESVHMSKAGWPSGAIFFDESGLAAMPEFLQNTSTTIGGIRVSGTTLWTDGTGGETDTDRITKERVKSIEGIKDFKKIRVAREGYRKLRVADVSKSHQRAKEFLQQTAEQRKGNKPWIVVTHHAPSLSAFANHPAVREEKGYPKASYASNMDSEIQQWNPDIWIHGHIHQPETYQVGNTRVFNVARGYPDEEFSLYTRIEVTYDEEKVVSTTHDVVTR